MVQQVTSRRQPMTATQVLSSSERVVVKRLRYRHFRASCSSEFGELVGYGVSPEQARERLATQLAKEARARREATG